ncbi:MAG: hypothetical protein KBS94_08310 [Prevotella sp.]|nr:hypothetical protein [Candidatus Equicola faecalis]
MKRLIFAVIATTCLSSCLTYNYNAQIPKEGEPVNPYSQKPITDYGITHAVRGIIISHK